MRLSSLFEGAPDLEITDLMSDSRLTCPGGLFFCVKGLSFDGHKYIQEAKKHGAVAVVYSDELEEFDTDLVYIRVDNVLDVLNQVAEKFYGYPSRYMRVLGVTGTNGKSTIAMIERYLIERFIPCGYIGTIGIFYGDKAEEEHLTTPDVVELNQVLHRMKEEGMEAVTLEVSSQGLDRNRVNSIHFACATFTNLTQDHFDYHLNFENYFSAKMRLFTMIDKDTPAVINIDDPYGKRFLEGTTGRPVTYAIDHEADYTASKVRLYPDNTTFTLKHDGKEYAVKSNLAAKFDVYNLVAALASIHEALGFELEDLIPYCETIPQVAGRVEQISEGQPFHVIVDYAHTPDGIQKFLEFCRTVTPKGNRLIAVFGSAGGRDAAKRSEMGKIASQYCNVIIFTSEDPRFEDPEQIAKQLASGITNNCTTMTIVDRYEAIRQGIELASANDTVVILGKGDETYMSVRGVSEEWMGDNNAAKEIIQKYFMSEEEDEHED